MKMHLKMSSVKWRQFCRGDELAHLLSAQWASGRIWRPLGKYSREIIITMLCLWNVYASVYTMLCYVSCMLLEIKWILLNMGPSLNALSWSLGWHTAIQWRVIVSCISRTWRPLLLSTTVHMTHIQAVIQLVIIKSNKLNELNEKHAPKEYSTPYMNNNLGKCCIRYRVTILWNAIFNLKIKPETCKTMLLKNRGKCI